MLSSFIQWHRGTRGQIGRGAKKKSKVLKSILKCFVHDGLMQISLGEFLKIKTLIILQHQRVNMIEPMIFKIFCDCNTAR